jgi:hypothetical protein
MSKQSEMEEIYESYEWLIRERLEQLDTLSRRMFSDMSLARIPGEMCEPFVQKKIGELMKDVNMKAGENIGKHSKLRAYKRKSTGHD